MNFDDSSEPMGEQWRALAYGNKPPMRPAQQARAAAQRPDGLTPVFNHAAKAMDGPPPKLRIDRQKLEKNVQKIMAEKRSKMSQPRPTLEPSPFGSVNRTINSRRDQKLAKEVSNLQKMLDKKLGKEQKPDGMTAKPSKYDLKRNFNKASMGRGM